MHVFHCQNLLARLEIWASNKLSFVSGLQAITIPCQFEKEKDGGVASIWLIRWEPTFTEISCKTNVALILVEFAVDYWFKNRL